MRPYAIAHVACVEKTPLIQTIVWLMLSCYLFLINGEGTQYRKGWVIKVKTTYAQNQLFSL
jgi:hypothetical protein